MKKKSTMFNNATKKYSLCETSLNGYTTRYGFLKGFLDFIKPKVYQKYLNRKDTGDVYRNRMIASTRDILGYIIDYTKIYSKHNDFVTDYMCYSRDRSDVAKASFIMAKEVTMLLGWESHKVIYDFDSSIIEALRNMDCSNAGIIDDISLPDYPCIYIRLDNAMTTIGHCHGNGIEGVYLYYSDFVATLDEAVRPDGPILADSELVVCPCFSFKTVAGNKHYDSANGAGKLNFNSKFVAPLSDADDTLLKSMLVYLSSENPDINRPPTNKLKMVSKNCKTSVSIPYAPEIIHVGKKFGSTMKRYRQQVASDKHHGRPIPHMRKAHWHSYWTGSKNTEQVKVIKWIAPILVNTDDIQKIPSKVVNCK